MMNDNIGIGVVTSTNLKARYQSCKDVWVNDFDNVFLFGGNIKDENLISIEKAGEDYNSHFLKQQLGLKYMYDHNPNYDWYVLASCDNVLFKEKVMKELSLYNRDEDFFLAQECGMVDYTDAYWRNHINGVCGGLTYMAAAGGGGIYLSNAIVKKCYSVIDEFNEFWTKNAGVAYPWSDSAISLMFKKHFDINITHSENIFGQHPSFYDDKIIGKAISFHYIKPYEMKEIYEKYK
jgi:hypothetical protein